MLKLHTLKPSSGSKRKRKRVGRGGAHGTTATRGTKGQKARSGYSRRFGFEGGRTSLVMQLPKLRGFKSLKAKDVSITLIQLDQAFKDGGSVTSASLKKSGLLVSRNETWKVVSKGELKKKLTVHGSVSSGAQKAIEAAGGTVVEKKASDNAAAAEKK
jgi:large subunit ribosomal protein L15